LYENILQQNMKASSNSPFSGLGGIIFLIGFMGSGKTHWGRIWAAKKQLPFFDIDHLVEEQAGKTIGEIFEQYGEAWFRQKETEVLKTFAAKQHCIVSCGGGLPCFNDNMQWMNEHGTTVYLYAKPAEIAKRLITEKDRRPLIKNLQADELVPFIENKLKERDAYYTAAKIILPVADVTAESIDALI
jgi:shikimate kinase